MNQSQYKSDLTPEESASTPTPVNVLPDVPFHLSNLDGFIQTIEFVPTYVPKRFIDQFLIVRSGGSTRAYLYAPNGWQYTTLT